MSDETGFSFIDTNILICAYDVDAGDRHWRARALIESLWDSGQGMLSTQVLNPAYSPPDLLRRPQARRLRRFGRSRILTGQTSTFPMCSVAKAPYPQDLEPPRDDRVANKPG